MTNSADYVAYVLELMRPARATARAMFGGHGVYVEGLMVALVDDDVLYLKCDNESRAAFEALGLPPFEYTARDGRRTVMGYCRAPDEALESAAAMADWLRSARAAALRAAATKPPAKRPSKRAARRPA